MDWGELDSFEGDSSSSYLSNLASTHNLSQINKICNHRGVYLDLIFSSTPTTAVIRPDDLLVAEDTHHPALSCSILLQNSSASSNNQVPSPVFDLAGTSPSQNVSSLPRTFNSNLPRLTLIRELVLMLFLPCVLKYCAPVLPPHLAIWFSSLLSLGIFPLALKRGFVVPIFKSGDRSNVKNYRPIFILSAVAKMYESIVLDYLYFNLRKCISSSQHGFLCSRSTVTNLMEFQEYVMAAFGNAHQVDCVYLDLSKGFDKVNHNMHVAKLARYGVGASCLSG
ncbi:uncharacterized protein LOC124355874 [Homalodisca vitripennis]|uniref:uncharacterized protein LOC124355874 n=1 Tax=Homalodisca vitripennis TaxID=197043 RepID=UPI001EECBD68|nr:uncharacterized protein LOC124355874 [Homalodisca vitripennis]